MDIAIILVLILLNAVFAMSEIAIVSSRKARLQQRIDEGHSSAAVALALANEPSHFLSTVQVGITSIGVLNGAFGEAAVADDLQTYFAGIPLLAPYSKGLALTIMVITITYLSVIVGELVPKRLALINPEGIAMLVARPMEWLSRAASPLVRFLSLSSEFVISLLRITKKDNPPVTEQEINVLMEQGAEAGIFEVGEPAMVSNILRLDEQLITSIMTPHVEMVYLDLDDPIEETLSKLIKSPHSSLPVCQGGFDNVIGILEAKDMLAQVLVSGAPDIAATVRPPLYVQRSVSSAELLETFRKNRVDVGLVVDDYGNLMGLVTLSDIVVAITGNVLEETDTVGAAQREDGSWLVDGTLSIEKFRQVLALEEMPGEADVFHTVGGFVMMQLGRVPKITDHFEWSGLRFEVIDMDRNRIDKVLVARIPAR